MLALNKGVEFYKENPDEAAASCAEALGITKEEALNQMKGATRLTLDEEIMPEYLGTSEKEGQFNQISYDTVVFLNEQKAIKNVPTKEEIKNFIQPKYIENAIKKNKE